MIKTNRYQRTIKPIHNILYSSMLINLFGSLLLCSCQQEDLDPEVHYSDDIYDLKEYKVERHPPVVRNGFGMDIYHQGNSGLDTMYLLSDRLLARHPNNCSDTGAFISRQYNEIDEEFKYDLLFYNEFAYSQSYTGDYNGTGNPVIFMYSDPNDINKSTQAVLVGIGIDYFNAFSTDSIAAHSANLNTDPLLCLADYRTELHTETVDGIITLQETIAPVYEQLVIGNKFRPNIGGVIENIDSDSEEQIYYQPVFLIKTREGYYAKFMITRFKGVGADTQKLTLQWQALR